MASHFTQPYNPTTINNPLYQAVPQQLSPLSFYSSPQLLAPTGTVYVTTTLQEVANVPVGVGTTVILCLPENTIFVKSVQNGIPITKQYSLTEVEQKTALDLEKENQQLKATLAALQEKLETTTTTSKGGVSQWQL